MKIDKTNKNTVQLDTKFIIVHSVFVVKIKIEYFGTLYYYTSKNIIGHADKKLDCVVSDLL